MTSERGKFSAAANSHDFPGMKSRFRWVLQTSLPASNLHLLRGMDDVDVWANDLRQQRIAARWPFWGSCNAPNDFEMGSGLGQGNRSRLTVHPSLQPAAVTGTRRRFLQAKAMTAKPSLQAGLGKARTSQFLLCPTGPKLVFCRRVKACQAGREARLKLLNTCEYQNLPA